MDVEKRCSNDYTNLHQNSADRENKVNVDLQKRLIRIAKKEGFMTYEIDIHQIISDGSNYLADLKEVTIKETLTKTKDDLKELNIFVKSILPLTQNNEMLPITEAFKREILAYTLSNVYEKIQDKAKVPLKERYNFVKCYDESNSELIIMENIAKKGYTICARLKIPPLIFFEKSVQQLAKFHALSFVLEKTQPSIFIENFKALSFPINMNNDWERFHDHIINSLSGHLEDVRKEKIKKFFPKLKENYKNLNGITSQGVKCLTHGDYRTNNIMMKKLDGELIVQPVDYQFLHYGHPISDLIYFIFGATDAAFRQKHLNDLKNMYFDTLVKFISYFDITIEDVYPRIEFEENYKENLIYGLMTTIFLAPFTLYEDGDQPDFISKPLSEFPLKVNDRIKKVLQDTIDEFINLGYL